MSAATVEISTAALDRLGKAFEASKLDAGDKRDLLTSLGLEVEEIARDRFETKLDPEGNPWEKVAEKTRAYIDLRFPGAWPPLVREGGLRDSLTSEIQGQDAILVGATKIYAAVHQFGRPEKNIPARPYLGISDKDAGMLADLARDFVEARLRKAARNV